MTTNKIKAATTFIIFLLLNFGALAIGGSFTGAGVPSSWYQTMNKAPWTPPGWVFGFAWTTIMICFSFYMSYWWSIASNKKWLIILFSLQWILNVGWNPVFFYHHDISLALFIITTLTLLIGYLLFSNWKTLKLKSIFLVPYFVWLVIATSLNFYAFMYN
jgi:translocator protein